MDICSSKDSDVNLVAEEDEINVDKECDDDMITDSNSNDLDHSHIVLYCFVFPLFIRRNKKNVNNNENLNDEFDGIISACNIVRQQISNEDSL